MKSLFLKTILTLSFLTGFTTTTNVLASDHTNARITTLGTYLPPSGTNAAAYSYVVLETGSRTAKPGCATRNEWILNNNDPERAKEQMSLLMLAFSQGRPVNIAGTNDCFRSGGIWPYEMVSTVYLTN